MKDLAFSSLVLCLLLVGCGQPGPLYLPTDKPPIYVEPEPEPEVETKKEVVKEPEMSPTTTNKQATDKK